MKTNSVVLENGIIRVIVLIFGLTSLLNGCIIARQIDTAFPQTRTVDYNFDTTVDFLSKEIGTNITQWTNSEYFTSVYPSNIMNNSEMYFFGTKKYIPGNKLVFEMYFAQIGGEWNIFTVERKASKTTDISLSQFAEFMIFFSFCRQNEINILNNIAHRMTNYVHEGKSVSPANKER